MIKSVLYPKISVVFTVGTNMCKNTLKLRLVQIDTQLTVYVNFRLMYTGNQCITRFTMYPEPLKYN